MDTATLPHSTLAELYRLAWLLTGDTAAAERALTEALTGSGPHLEGLRSAGQRNAYLIGRLRKSCHTASRPEPSEIGAAPRLLREEPLEAPEILEIEAYIVARHIHTLPELDRTALALFYLELLTPLETAKLLALSLEQYGGILGRARVKLHDNLRALQTGATMA